MASYTYTVTNSGNHAYVIDGELNPPLSLQAGNRYTFNVNAPGHPFYIKTDRVLGDGSAYNFQVIGNGTEVGTVTIELDDGPEPKLFYQCANHLKMGNRLTNVQHIDTGIQNLIGEQLPGFVGVQYPMFQKFLEAYYEWMSLPGNVDDNTQNILKYQDVDSSIDLYLSELEQEFLNQVPKDIEIDKATLIKNIRSFYTSKGTEKSYEFLFNILFNENVEFYYPKNDILRASDGKWTTNVSIRLTNPSNYNVFDLVGQKISQDYLYVDPETNQGEVRIYATAVVQRIIQFFLGDTLITEAYISNYESVDGNDFLVSTSDAEEDTQVVYIRDELKNIINFPIQPMATDVQVVGSGSGYSANQIVPIQTTPGDNGTGAIAVVSSVFNGEVEGLTITQPGANYQVGDQLRFINDGTGGIGASGFVTKVSQSGMTYNSGDGGFVGAGTSASRLTDGDVNNEVVPGDSYSKDYVFKVVGDGNFNYIFNITDQGNDGVTTINYYEVYVGDTVNEVNDPAAVPSIQILNETDLQELTGTLNIPDEKFVRIRFEAELTSINQNANYWDPENSDPANIPTFLPQQSITSTAWFTGTGEIKGLRLQSGGSGYVKIPVVTVQSEFGSGGAIRATGPTIGAIKNARILNQNFGALYYEVPTIDMTSLGNGDAQLTVSTGSVARHPGSFRNDDGHLSAAKYLQDNKYYQAFSYVLRTGLSIQDYRDTIKKLVHPSGMELFGEVFITQNLATGLFSNFENSPNDLIVRPDLGGLAIPRFKKVVLKYDVYLNGEADGAVKPRIRESLKQDKKIIRLNMNVGVDPTDLRVFNFPNLMFPIQRDIENIIIDNTIEVSKTIEIKLWRNYNTLLGNAHILDGFNHDETSIENLESLYSRIKDYNNMSLTIALPVTKSFPKYVLNIIDELTIETYRHNKKIIDLDIDNTINTSRVINRKFFDINATDVQMQIAGTDDERIKERRIISKSAFLAASIRFEMQRELQSNVAINATAIPVDVIAAPVTDDVNVIQIILGYKELGDFTKGFDTSGTNSIQISDVEGDLIKDLDRETNTVMDALGPIREDIKIFRIQSEVIQYVADRMAQGWSENDFTVAEPELLNIYNYLRVEDDGVTLGDETTGYVNTRVHVVRDGDGVDDLLVINPGTGRVVNSEVWDDYIKTGSSDVGGDDRPFFQDYDDRLRGVFLGMKQTELDNGGFEQDYFGNEIFEIKKSFNTTGVDLKITPQLDLQAQSSSLYKLIIDKDIDATGEYITSIHASLPVESMIKLQPVSLDTPIEVQDMQIQTYTFKSIQYGPLLNTTLGGQGNTQDTYLDVKRVVNIESNVVAIPSIANRTLKPQLMYGALLNYDGVIIEDIENDTIEDTQGKESQTVTVSSIGYIRDNTDAITGTFP